VLVVRTDGDNRAISAKNIEIEKTQFRASLEIREFRNSMEQNKLNPVQKEKGKDFNHSKYIFRIKNKSRKV
jgi:hypothetical protein